MSARLQGSGATVAALLLLIPSALSAQGYMFADLKWGTKRAATTEALAQRGYRKTSADELTSFFEGRAFGGPASVLLMFTPKSMLAAAMVTLSVSDEDKFRDVTSALRDKYGDPDERLDDSTWVWKIEVPAGKYQLVAAHRAAETLISYSSPLSPIADSARDSVKRARLKSKARDL